MEEEKAAAYYDELCRKGEGAARFKQGLGFSSTSNDAVPSRGSALSSSSFFSKFVKASNPSDSKPDETQKQIQLESVQNKLKKKPNEARTETSSRVSRDTDRDNGLSSRRSRSRSRDSARHSRRRSRSRSRSRDRNRDRHSRHRRRSRSRDSGRRSRRRSRSSSGDRDGRSRRRSRSRDDYRRRRGDRSGSRERARERCRRSRSESQHRRKSEKCNGDSGGREKERNVGVDYAKLIEGYDKMTPAERVKAKMKLQLTETAEKDEIKGMGSGWERFNFDKDAPLDDEEIEAAEDDSELVKHIGQSFRFSAVEAKREEKIKAAHDEAMFGAPSLPPSTEIDDEGGKYSKKEASLTSEPERDFIGEASMDTSQNTPVASLISDQVMTMQQGSWRDRIRKM